MSSAPPPDAPEGDPPPGRAYFQTASGTKIGVDFNPANLRITLSNQFGEDPPEQHARATTAKLDVELVFDTTETGGDVREKTQKLHELTIATATAKQQASGGKGAAQKEPNCSVPKVSFYWGTSSYTGIIETLTETLDYWSSDGVPLRATLQIAMKGAGGEHATYTASAQLYSKGGGKKDPAPAPPDSTPVTAPPDGSGATGAASSAGDPGAGRFLAASNGLENMRAPGGVSLDASASINLSAAASFQVSGGISAGIGISAGVSIGFGAGASLGASAAAGLSASVGIGMSAGAAFGASAGAGFGASAGAEFGASAGAGAGAAAGAGFGASASAGAAAGASFGARAGAAAAIVAGPSGGGSVVMISAGSSRASAGISASQGAFAGLGASKTVLPSAAFDPGRLLPPPRPAVGIDARFDETGRIVSGDGQVAASWAASGVTFF